MLFDVIVVGGSFAGMAAALQIARTRRPVLVIDSGLRRNRFAAHAHGFISQDGTPPANIAATARTQLLAYPNVTWIDGTAENARKEGDRFVVDVNRASQEGRRMVLATGVVDTLPDIPGLAERWGTSVFHCPYCHGYELGVGTTSGVLACHPLSIHQAEVVADWGPTIYFANGSALSDEEAASLAHRGVTFEPQTVAEIVGDGMKIQLLDGRTIALAGLYIVSQTSVASPIAAQLGCAFDDGMTGPIIRVDETKRTTVDGVFACGDAARSSGFLATAAGDGIAAGMAAHQSLIFDDGARC